MSRVMVHIDIPDAETGFEIASTFGIAVYDDLVRGIAGKIKEVFGKIADIYHLANGQFALISRELSAAQFIPLLKKNEEELLRPVQSVKVPLNLHSYGGYVEFLVSDGTASEVSRKALSAAHSAFIRQKRWSEYDLADDNRSQRAFRLLNDLPHAIDSEQLYLMYQPKFDVKNRSVASAEALIRWGHPDLGEIPPSEFIPLVEKTALIRNLSEWVFNSALRQLKEWMNAGIFLRMSINLSGRNFMEPDLLERLKRECEQREISPDWIEIECTEGVWMNGPEVAANLAGIRDLGFTIALDDFGSGYSNFSYLQQIPASVLKFDRSLIQNMETNERDNSVVRSLAALAQRLGYRIVVEGVESEKTFAELSSLGIDEIQGYFFSRPLSPDTFEQFVKNVSLSKDFIGWRTATISKSGVTMKWDKK